MIGSEVDALSALIDEVLNQPQNKPRIKWLNQPADPSSNNCTPVTAVNRVKDRVCSMGVVMWGISSFRSQ